MTDDDDCEKSSNECDCEYCSGFGCNSGCEVCGPDHQEDTTQESGEELGETESSAKGLGSLDPAAWLNKTNKWLEEPDVVVEVDEHWKQCYDIEWEPLFTAEQFFAMMDEVKEEFMNGNTSFDIYECMALTAAFEDVRKRFAEFTQKDGGSE